MPKLFPSFPSDGRRQNNQMERAELDSLASAVLAKITQHFSFYPFAATEGIIVGISRHHYSGASWHDGHVPCAIFSIYGLEGLEGLSSQRAFSEVLFMPERHGGKIERDGNRIAVLWAIAGTQRVIQCPRNVYLHIHSSPFCWQVLQLQHFPVPTFTCISCIENVFPGHGKYIFDMLTCDTSLPPREWPSESQRSVTYIYRAHLT
jgi:hypothetical protein